MVSALFRWPCSMSIHLPSLSLLVSVLVRWPCSISIHVSPRPVTGGVRPFSLAMQHVYSFVSEVCHCWCPPFSAGDATFLFMCPRPATGGARPFPLAFLFLRLPGLSLVCPFLLAMKHFYSFASQVRYCWCPPFSVGHVAFLFICLPGLSLLVSALFRWRCNSSIHLCSRSVTACPTFSAGHAAFLFICFPCL